MNWKGGVSVDNRKEYMKKVNKYNYELNKEEYKVKARLRRVNSRTTGKIDLNVLQMLYEDNIKKYGTLTCYLCLKPIEFGKDCLEHKTPISRGGTNEYNNLELCHRGCNASKRSRTIEEYVSSKI